MSAAVPDSVRVLMPDGTVTACKLETFLAGVVYAEMGAAAPLEALKAQAVASRNYAAAAHRHPEFEADVCTTIHCQEHKPVDPMAAPEVFRAVSETSGMVATFERTLIDAFFFEHCDGRTRNAEDLLPAPVPYLKSVECGCGFVARKGHGIGLCQRGAIAMARQGATFEQILKHYYGNVVVTRSVDVEQTQPGPMPEPAFAEPEPTITDAILPQTAEPPGPVSVPVAVSPELIRLPEPQLDFVEDAAALEEPAPNAIEQTRVELPVEPSPTPVPPTPVEPTPADLPREQPAQPQPIEPVAGPQAVPPGVQPVPLYVEQLNIAASMSAQDIIQASAAQAQPTDETPAQAPILDSDFPAFDEVGPAARQRIHVDHLPGPRMIAGCLDGVGLVVTVEDMHGHQTLIFSGSAPHYGAGGFETVVGEDGRYVVTIYAEQVSVDVTGDTAFIHIL